MEYISAIKMWKFSIFGDMDVSQEYQAKQNQSNGKNWEPYVFTHRRDVKLKTVNEKTTNNKGINEKNNKESNKNW